MMRVSVHLTFFHKKRDISFTFEPNGATNMLISINSKHIYTVNIQHGCSVEEFGKRMLPTVSSASSNIFKTQTFCVFQELYPFYTYCTNVMIIIMNQNRCISFPYKQPVGTFEEESLKLKMLHMFIFCIYQLMFEFFYFGYRAILKL